MTAFFCPLFSYFHPPKPFFPCMQPGNRADTPRSPRQERPRENKAGFPASFSPKPHLAEPLPIPSSTQRLADRGAFASQLPI